MPKSRGGGSGMAAASLLTCPRSHQRSRFFTNPPLVRVPTHRIEAARVRKVLSLRRVGSGVPAAHARGFRSPRSPRRVGSGVPGTHEVWVPESLQPTRVGCGFP